MQPGKGIPQLEILSCSSSRFLPIQERSKFPLPLTMPYKFFDERFVVERPFDILGLTNVTNEGSAGNQDGLTFAKRGFSSSSSTEVFTESAFSIHRSHVPGNSSTGMFMIWTSLDILCAPKSFAKTGGVGF